MLISNVLAPDSGSKNEGDDETVESEYFGEYENEDHPDVKARLLGSPTNASVADDPDGEPGGQATQADGQASS